MGTISIYSILTAENRHTICGYSASYTPAGYLALHDVSNVRRKDRTNFSHDNPIARFVDGCSMTVLVGMLFCWKVERTHVKNWVGGAAKFIILTVLPILGQVQSVVLLYW